MKKIKVAWWWLLIVLIVVLIMSVLVARKNEPYASTDKVICMVETFCDKHYGKDKWFLDSVNTFNDQLSFVVIRTFDGGQTDVSVLPKNRTIILEGSTSVKTPTARFHPL